MFPSTFYYLPQDAHNIPELAFLLSTLVKLIGKGQDVLYQHGSVQTNRDPTLVKEPTVTHLLTSPGR